MNKDRDCAQGELLCAGVECACGVCVCVFCVWCGIVLCVYCS